VKKRLTDYYVYYIDISGNIKENYGAHHSINRIFLKIEQSFITNSIALY